MAGEADGIEPFQGSNLLDLLTQGGASQTTLTLGFGIEPFQGSPPKVRAKR